MEEIKDKKIGSIVLEGSDQSGKTTFAAKLAKWMSEILGREIKTMHFVKSDYYEQVQYYTTPLLKEGPFVIDRNYVSELVYGPLFRGKSAIDESAKAAIEKAYSDANAFVVLLKRENYKWEDRDEMYTKDDNIKVIKAFDDIYDSLNIDKMKVDAFNEDSLRMVIHHWMNKNNLNTNV